MLACVTSSELALRQERPRRVSAPLPACRQQGSCPPLTSPAAQEDQTSWGGGSHRPGRLAQQLSQGLQSRRMELGPLNLYVPQEPTFSALSQVPWSTQSSARKATTQAMCRTWFCARPLSPLQETASGLASGHPGPKRGRGGHAARCCCRRACRPRAHGLHPSPAPGGPRAASSSFPVHPVAGMGPCFPN